MLRHDLARGGHQQREPGRALGEERLQRLDHPRLERPHQPSRPAASSISSRARPRLASGPTTATSTRSSAPGRGQHAAALAAQMHEGRRPQSGRARRCAPGAPPGCPASAAAAWPSTPSMSCSATTSPSLAETTSAPRTPRHPGDPVERRLGRRSCLRLQPRARGPRRALGEQPDAAPSAATAPATASSTVSALGGARTTCPSGDSTAIACQAPETQQPGGAARPRATRPRAGPPPGRPRRSPPGRRQACRPAGARWRRPAGGPRSPSSRSSNGPAAPARRHRGDAARGGCATTGAGVAAGAGGAARRSSRTLRPEPGDRLRIDGVVRVHVQRRAADAPARPSSSPARK